MLDFQQLVLRVSASWMKFLLLRTAYNLVLVEMTNIVMFMFLFDVCMYINNLVLIRYNSGLIQKYVAVVKRMISCLRKLFLYNYVL